MTHEINKSGLKIQFRTFPCALFFNFQTFFKKKNTKNNNRTHTRASITQN